MEVIPLIRNSATGSEASKGDNGIKRHVQEWSRLDRLTGILEHARVEADQWTNHTANTKHKYGKVVDRRARNLADGSKEETQQTKQLEVFQAHTAGCSVQVIRSQTSTTSSWHNSSAGSNAFQWPSSIFDKKDNQFDQLRLEHSPLDVSSQKSKATVGRSGSISTRRPPTRRPQAVISQLPKIESIDSTDTMETSSSLNENVEESVSTNLNRLKSCSNDEIRSDINESEEPLDRSSRFRRSLQFAQSKNIESNHKVAGELENVLKKVLGKKLQAVDGDIVDEYSLIKPASPLKKPTFITVESLKKTKNNLRHLNEDKDKDDDGIETDVKPTGDSRSLDYRGSALTRTEEWYNRRKSYGFEKVTTSDHNGKYATDPSAMDSSTDSGICRSTENGLSNSSRQSSVDRESIADLVKKYSNKEINNNTQVHAYNTTVVAKGKILEAINSLRSKSSAYFDVVKPSDTISESTENDESEKEQVYMRRLSVGMDMAMDKNVNRDEVPKRHSIAVVSEVADKEPGIDKKNGNKKVEFCRTEVHFDATPGKINIVDMEDKPAPAQLYRPKKRYNRPPEKNSHGLPEYRFGDDVHSDVVLQINGTGNQNGGNSGNECPTTEDEATDNGSSMPKSILKRQQLQHQQQSQHQQQQQKASDNSGGVASDNGIEVRISSTESTPVDCRRASWSVADRVKQVEAVGFSTRVNFTEGETTAVGFDPADPRKQRYSYNGSASPVWYQNNGNSPSATADTSAKCHEKLLVRIGGGACNGKPNGASTAADLCAFSRCFSDQSAGNHLPLSSASLVMNTKFRTTEQPSTYLEEMNTKVLGRFQKAVSTSWPRYGHKTYPTPATRKHNVLKSCADIKRDRAAKGMPDVIGALDDLSKSIDAQIVDRTSDRHHVTLIKVRQPCDEIHGRLEYAKDLMSTDETSEESLKADEEVRSYMAADCVHEDDRLPECKNLKKLISTVKKNITQSQCSQDNRLKKTDVKTYESTLVVPNVTSVLLNHEKQLEPERSQFQPVSVHTSQVTHVVKHQFDDSLQKQPSKRVPVKIVQDNRKCKPKTDAPITKICATVSLKQVPMTVQPKPVQSNENKKKPAEKKESIYGNIGYRANSLRVKDKPATNKQAQDLFSTGRDSWLNMPKDLGPKLNKSKATTYKSRVNRKETVDSEVSVLEELNRAADEILKAVNGYTDDESQLPNDAGDNKTKTNLDHSEAKLKNKKKAARLLQRANSREALLHLDEVSSSEEDAADEVQRIKPKMQRKTKTQSQTTTNSVATKTTASFTKKIQSRAQNVTKTNVQHKVHPTYYGNVSSCTQAPMKFRNKPSESLAKQIVVDQKDTKGRYQCKITARTFNSKKLKGSVEENKNSIKGC